MGTLTKKEKNFIFYGRYGEEIDVNQKTKSRFGWKFRPRGWEGIINLLRRRYAQTESDLAKEHYQKHMVSQPCQTCNGHRLNAEALAVKINGLSIASFGDLSIRDALSFISTLPLSPYEKTYQKNFEKKSSID